MYDGCILAAHAPDDLRLLGDEATYDERRILGAFQYAYSLLEEGGTMFTFEGTGKKCFLKSVLGVHNPQFYWKVMTQADLGLADAYINGDFSFVDKDEGLLNLFLVLIANRDLNASNSKLKKNRGWWTPVLFTVGLASTKFFMEHVSRKNTLTQARRNNSRHYDLLCYNIKTMFDGSVSQGTYQ